MYLMIQVPCLDEEGTLPALLASEHGPLPGISKVEWLVVDDGSTDRTAYVAQESGVDHVLKLERHVGLARAFKAGIDYSLALGADIVVNTDGDNQYRLADLPKLVAPIVNGEADVVIGQRTLPRVNESLLSRLLRHVGSALIRRASRTSISDVCSGYRAYSRAGAEGVEVISRYTYTLDSLISAGRAGMRIRSVQIGTNAPTRRSRLVTSRAIYVGHAMLSCLRAFYRFDPPRPLGRDARASIRRMLPGEAA